MTSVMEIVKKSIDSVIEPVTVKKFTELFSKKWLSFGNIITPQLLKTWELNCVTMNQVAISNKHKVKIVKYIVSAVTGSGKTECQITYCSLLPKHIKVLISTNLTDEADRIGQAINNESGDKRASAFHTKNSTTIEEASQYQIVVVSHEFYRRNFDGGERWNELVADRDLVIIDEALDTLKEVSISKKDIDIAINIFTELSKWKKYQKDRQFQNDFEMLKYEKEILMLLVQECGGGTKLINSEKSYDIPLEQMHPSMFPSYHGQRIHNILGLKYNYLKEILTRNSTIKYNAILTKRDDSSKDRLIRNDIIKTLNNLEKLVGNQVYITANKGDYSYNHVIDSTPKKSLVCFDATADVNQIYNIRAKYHNDLAKIEKFDKVRNYDAVTLHLVPTNTGKGSIQEKNINSILKSIIFGKQTLIICHKENEAIVSQIIRNTYSDKDIKISHWGAITGLNTWKEFDTCVIIGLNHKPKSFSQNRVNIASNEEIAFGENQKVLNHAISTSDISSEIIQAINRIRVRKIISSDGGCESANIYLTLPVFDFDEHVTLIRQQMLNISIKDWDVEGLLTVAELKKGHLQSILLYLESHLMHGDEISIYEPRNTLNINGRSYSDIINAKDFEEKLKITGYEILTKKELDSKGRAKKRASKYIRKI